MKITEILSNKRVNLSYEFFPPRRDSSFDSVLAAAETVAGLNPAFVSITYGASGGASHNTVRVADTVKNDLGITTLAHLTGATLDEAEALDILRELKGKGIENILALRGDLVAGSESQRRQSFHHASELIHFIKQHEPSFCVGAACYPEGHVESRDKKEDILYLKLKQDFGADFLTSQMFFDNNIFYNFMYRLRDAGITIPVVAGIMPIVSYEQIKKVGGLSGSNFPASFINIADKFKYNPEAFRTAMINYTCTQIIDLIANGVTNIHIYTMNRGETAERIHHNLGAILSI
ncbi:MAG: methylenetetrahydrofolate reductase [Porphyromonas sp.]|nr:methylenetetrahydrofolate reductase [Porphyromonas sp.]